MAARIKVAFCDLKQSQMATKIPLLTGRGPARAGSGRLPSCNHANSRSPFPSTPGHSCFDWKKPTKPLPAFETDVCRARRFSDYVKSKRQNVAKLDALKHWSGSEPVVVVGVVQVVAVHWIEAREQDIPVAVGVHAFRQRGLAVKVCRGR